MDFIRKRDGRLVPYEEGKIVEAIGKAVRAVGGSDMRKAAEIAGQVGGILRVLYKDERVPTVENVQDLVEKILIENGHAQTAKAYILYRSQHESLRKTQELMKESAEAIDSYLVREDWRVNENANMGYSLQGLNNHIASSITSNYWLSKIYPQAVAEAHRAGDFHIHDLGMLSVYCCGWDLKDLLLKGFTGAYGKVQSAPAKHFRSALGQIVNFFYTLQGEAAGAQAFANFDTLLAPFIAYDRLSYGEVRQCLQEFIFNMNVPTRVGFQTPFTNVTMDMMVPRNMAQEAVIIGGQLQERCYAEFQEEMDLLNRAFCEVMMAGDAAGRIFSFPIPTYNITSDLNWDSDRLQPVWEMTAKYGIPYFSNFVNSDLDPEDARSMCPLSGDEKVLMRSSRGRGVEYSKIRYIFEGNSKQENYEIFSNGKFVSGSFNKFTDQKMLTAELVNGHKITMTAEHLNFVLTDFEKNQETVLSGSELTEGMYLPYSLNVYEGEGGNRELGIFVGAYAGDGSTDGSNTVIFSLEDEKKKSLIPKLQRIASNYFGAHTSITRYKTTKLVTLKVHSKAAVGLCLDFVEGKQREKRYAARVFTMSEKFRRGVLVGHYATDGGNRHRIYTSSKKMVESINMLAATLGTTTSIFMDDRKGRLGTEPNYAVLVYQLNRNNYGDLCLKHDGKLWVKIKSIYPAKHTTAYCFEVKNDEPMFTVGTTGILTHNCRLRLDNRELRRRGGGLFGSNPLTGSIGVVTINLPRAAYQAMDIPAFLEQVGELMDLASQSLELKRKQLERLTGDGLYPYSSFYLAAIQERSGHFWDNHFSTIGLIGMNEACLNLLGCGIDSPAGEELARETLDYMRRRLEDFQDQTGNLYNLEATPAEGTSYRLASQDRRRFPEIITAGSEEAYYTNSTQLPVGSTEDIFSALEHQDRLQTLYTGGTVFHGFLGERIEDWRSARLLVRRIAENFHLPYFTLSPTFTICPVHGYINGEHFDCPYQFPEAAA